METIIVSIDDFRTLTGSSDSVDDDLITSVIIKAQDLHCQGILGTALTAKLIADYNADSLDGLYLELYDSLKASVRKMVVQQAFRYGLSSLAFRISNGQIVKGSANAEAASSQDIADLKQDAEALVILYENQVKTFLSKNYSDIPELQDTTPEYLKANTTPSNGTSGFANMGTITYNDI